MEKKTGVSSSFIDPSQELEMSQAANAQSNEVSTRATMENTMGYTMERYRKLKISPAKLWVF